MPRTSLHPQTDRANTPRTARDSCTKAIRAFCGYYFAGFFGKEDVTREAPDGRTRLRLSPRVPNDKLIVFSNPTTIATKGMP
jgi:hypothetical protein